MVPVSESPTYPGSNLCEVFLMKFDKEVHGTSKIWKNTTHLLYILTGDRTTITSGVNLYNTYVGWKKKKLETWLGLHLNVPAIIKKTSVKIRKDYSIYLIGKNFVGKKWRNFRQVTKIFTDENFSCRSKVLGSLRPKSDLLRIYSVWNPTYSRKQRTKKEFIEKASCITRFTKEMFSCRILG